MGFRNKMAIQPKEKISLGQFRTVLIVAGILIVVVVVKNFTGIFKSSNTATNQQTYYNGPVTLRGDQQTATTTADQAPVPGSIEDQLSLARSIRQNSEPQVQPAVLDRISSALGFDPNAVSTTDPYFYIRMALVGLNNNNPYIQQMIVDGQSSAK